MGIPQHLNTNKHTRQAANNITLFIPGLLGLTEVLKHLPERDIPALKNLSRFLCRAEKKSVNIYGWHAGLASLFQFEKLPAAELRYRHFADADEKAFFYLCADPVHIQPDLNSAVLLAHEELNFSLDDARELATTINEHFIEENWTLEVITPHHWIIKLGQAPLLTTTPLVALVGQPIGSNLAQGKDSAYWQRIENEIQMLLFAHPLNQQREAQGNLLVNSLWLWGEGSLPQTVTAGWDAISGQGELLEALKGWCGCDGKMISINDKLVFNSTGQTLLASDEFISPVKNQDFYAWIDSLKAFEHNWLDPLMKTLAAGKLDSVDLLAGNGMQFSLNRKMLKRWWRRTKPFQEFL